ncbi:MAG: LuxR C-terminal-related transcriptional regulator, partial [Acidimicrobiia bacterium]
VVQMNPDAVIVDVQLPSGSGADVVAGAKERGATSKFVALSVSAARSDVVSMLQAGVDGYLLKSTLGAQLPDLVDETLGGGRPVSPQIAGYMLDIADESAGEPTIESLTEREREVVELIARGYSYRKTASTLFVSTKTIEAHMHNIFEKLGVASRHELSMKAYKAGWMEDDFGRPPE